MDSESLLSNPFVLVFGGIALLLILYFWSRANTKKARQRRQRSFRRDYYERKKAKAIEKESEETKK